MTGLLQRDGANAARWPRTTIPPADTIVPPNPDQRASSTLYALHAPTTAQLSHRMDSLCMHHQPVLSDTEHNADGAADAAVGRDMMGRRHDIRLSKHNRLLGARWKTEERRRVGDARITLTLLLFNNLLTQIKEARKQRSRAV